MRFYYEIKTKEDAEQLAGLTFFEENDEPLVISGKNLKETYDCSCGGYDYEGSEDDASYAIEAIKEKVTNARVAYCSEEDEGTGAVSVAWSDFDEDIVHEAYLDDFSFDLDDIGTDEWMKEVKEYDEDE